MQALRNIWQLTVKEFIGLASDTFMVIFIVYSFSFAVYSQATGVPQELKDASIAYDDEDKSQLSGRIIDALLPPLFQKPVPVRRDEIDRAMDSARFTFVVAIPPSFEADVVAGRSPDLQVLVDATALKQAGLGTSYITKIINNEITQFMASRSPEKPPPVTVQVRPAFNQSLTGTWFTGSMSMI